MKTWHVYADGKYIGTVFARTYLSARRAAINQLGLTDKIDFSVIRK